MYNLCTTHVRAVPPTFVLINYTIIPFSALKCCVEQSRGIKLFPDKYAQVSSLSRAELTENVRVCMDEVVVI